MRRLLALCASAWLLLATSAIAADHVTEVVSTQRPAEELLPVLEPLGGDDVSLQAWRGQLVISGPAARVQEILAVLKTLDAPLQNLRISVRRAGGGGQRGGAVSIGVHPDDTRVRVQQEQVEARGTGEQQLTVLEGTAAWLSVDREVPVLVVAPDGTVSGDYQPLGNGVTLRAARAGERIRLDIVQRVAAMDDGSISAQSVSSVLLLDPGTWTPLARVARSDGARRDDTVWRIGPQGAGIDSRRVRDTSAWTDWEVKVDWLAP